jgi:hypothetical protein
MLICGLGHTGTKKEYKNKNGRVINLKNNMFNRFLEKIAQLIAHYLYPYKIRTGEEQIFCMNTVISKDNHYYLKEEYIDCVKKDMILKLADTIYKEGFATVEESEDKNTGNKILSAKLVCKKY